MVAPLLDPLIVDTLVRGGRGNTGLSDLNNVFKNFNMTRFILNIVLPFIVFLSMAIFVKLKYDKKQNKNNLNI